MAIYRHTYSRYKGPLTPQWERFLVIPRYAFEEMHQSRFLMTIFVASLIVPLVYALLIYLHHNMSALQALKIPENALLSINSAFFLSFLGVESMFAFLISAFVGPGQVSPDLANGALALYLARPFSRAEYVLGKLSVLAGLLSCITWVPGLLLFGLQSSLAGGGWMWNHLRIAIALFLGAWIWILVLSLLALALSAWVKWKPAAGALLFGVFFVASGFGAAMNASLHTKWGNLMNLSNLVGTVWVSLFDEPLRRGGGAAFFRIGPGDPLPPWTCWFSLIAISLFSLLLLRKKIRAMEVVR